MMKKTILIAFMCLFLTCSVVLANEDTFGQMANVERTASHKDSADAMFPMMDWSGVVAIGLVEIQGEIWTQINRNDGSWVITTDQRFIGIATQAYTVGTVLIIQWTSPSTLNAFYTGLWW